MEEAEARLSKDVPLCLSPSSGSEFKYADGYVSGQEDSELKEAHSEDDNSEEDDNVELTVTDAYKFSIFKADDEKKREPVSILALGFDSKEGETSNVQLQLLACGSSDSSGFFMRQIDSWTIELEGDRKLRLHVRDGKGTWIKLHSPSKGYETSVRSALIIVNFLELAMTSEKTNAKTCLDQLMAKSRSRRDYLKKILRKYYDSVVKKFISLPRAPPSLVNAQIIKSMESFLKTEAKKEKAPLVKKVSQAASRKTVVQPLNKRKRVVESDSENASDLDELKGMSSDPGRISKKQKQEVESSDLEDHVPLAQRNFDSSQRSDKFRDVQRETMMNRDEYMSLSSDEDGDSSKGAELPNSSTFRHDGHSGWSREEDFDYGDDHVFLDAIYDDDNGALGEVPDEEVGDAAFCAICDDGGDLLFCDGPCMRSFHPSKEAASSSEESQCFSLGYTVDQVKEMGSWQCQNCQHQQHQCYICGQLGSSREGEDKEVFVCAVALCGRFYHPHCLAEWKSQEKFNSIADKDAIIERVKEGVECCPAHKCTECGEGEEEGASDDSMKLAKCRRCPKAYHKACLPSDISFPEEDREPVRAWNIDNRLMIYCLKHRIIRSLKTPARDHLNWPCIAKGDINPPTGIYGKIIRESSLKRKSVHQDDSDDLQRSPSPEHHHSRRPKKKLPSPVHDYARKCWPSSDHVKAKSSLRSPDHHHAKKLLPSSDLQAKRFKYSSLGQKVVTEKEKLAIPGKQVNQTKGLVTAAKDRNILRAVKDRPVVSKAPLELSINKAKPFASSVKQAAVLRKPEVKKVLESATVKQVETPRREVKKAVDAFPVKQVNISRRGEGKKALEVVQVQQVPSGKRDRVQSPVDVPHLSKRKVVEEKATSVPTLDKQAQHKRLSRLLQRASETFTLESIKSGLAQPSCYGESRKNHTMHRGSFHSVLAAMRKAAEKLKNGGDVDDAKQLCPKESFLLLLRYVESLRVYLAPLLHGMRYTSFGRHFTCVDKLKEIVERIHPYIDDGDMVVDFCCGANDFSVILNEKLKSTGKTCHFRNFDIHPPKNGFCFTKGDWLKQNGPEFFDGKKLIMGLNPPFGVRAALANQFVEHALKFNPKLLVLIVPPETMSNSLRYKDYNYHLVWEDKNLLSGHAFYLPGSIDNNEREMTQWNKVTPPLYLWSRGDMLDRHKSIALRSHHIEDLSIEVSMRMQRKNSMLSPECIEVPRSKSIVENLTSSGSEPTESSSSKQPSPTISPHVNRLSHDGVGFQYGGEVELPPNRRDARLERIGDSRILDITNRRDFREGIPGQPVCDYRLGMSHNSYGGAHAGHLAGMDWQRYGQPPNHSPQFPYRAQPLASTWPPPPPPMPPMPPAFPLLTQDQAWLAPSFVRERNGVEFAPRQREESYGVEFAPRQREQSYRREGGLGGFLYD